MRDPRVLTSNSFTAYRSNLRSRDTVSADGKSAHLILPYDLLGIFCRSYENSKPLDRLPIYALAEIGYLPAGEKENDGQGEPDTRLMRFPLGLLGTDHVGYASFDLTVLRASSLLHEFLRRFPAPAAPPPPLLGLRHLWVMPFADVHLRRDALKDGELGSPSISLRIELDAGDLIGRESKLPMASMQNPGIADWRLSPGSFTVSGSLIVGEDGCETLLPANLSTQQFRFRQVARDSAPSLEARAGSYELGHLLEYTTEWFSIGHSLGQIVYSLPLAPGEKRKIAVIDWSRQDVAKRDEATALEESIVHDAVRDRSLSETVHAALNEWQRGGSVMGGVAASGSMGMFGGAAALGGGYTTSSGSRDLAADTTQRINDAFHQASTAMRELRSTVVVQGTQAEAANLQTRVIANYNHSHALTMLYYEVLRHYRIVTRLDVQRLALLVDYSLEQKDFEDYDTILAWRSAIEAVLLDEKLRSCLDVVAKRACLKLNLDRAKERLATVGDPLDDLLVDEITVEYTTGAQGPSQSVDFAIIPRDGGVPIPCALVDLSLIVLPHINSLYPFAGALPPVERFPPNSQFVYIVKPSTLVRWKNVAMVQIAQVRNGSTGTGPSPWDLKHVRVTTKGPSGVWELVDIASPGNIARDSFLRVPVNGFVPPVESVDDLLLDEELCCLDRLKKHLVHHGLHYNQAIWISESPSDRLVRWMGKNFTDKPLVSIVENRPVDVSGNALVFPVSRIAESFVLRAFKVQPGDHLATDEFVEQLLTLPTRGVFGEAKLGHCNASEIIDNTRFWDWKESPIPDETPEISDVSGKSRFQKTEGTEATAFPASLVNIVNPQSLPDPTAMTSALGLFAAMGGFRDMSAAKEVAALLQTLSNNATLLAGKQPGGAGGANGKPGQTGGNEGAIPAGAGAGGNNTSAGPGDARGGGNAGGVSAAGGSDRTSSGGSDTGGSAGTGGTGIGDGTGSGAGGRGGAGGNGVGGGGKVPVEPTKAPRTQVARTGLVRFAFYFKDFEPFGGVRAVWGNLLEFPPKSNREWIPGQAPQAGQVALQAQHITGDGTVDLSVQLGDAASTLRMGTARYEVQENLLTVIRVSPRTKNVEVTSNSKESAEADAKFKFQVQWGGELPYKLVLLRVQNQAGADVGIHGAISKEETYKFTFVGLEEGLKWGGAVHKDDKG